MKARITSASHIWPDKSGLLRIRVDFFPDVSDPLYDGCHVQVPERPLTPEERPEWEKCKTDECRNALLVKWGIAKVWRVNPINCHMFLLPIGFTQEDLNLAIAERLVNLKYYMRSRELAGYADISIDDMPKSLLRATCPLKGEGQVLIPTLEKKWTPELVSQAGIMLNGLEVQE